MEWLKKVPVRLLLAFALLQGLFWLLFYPAFVQPPRPQVDFLPASGFEIAQLASPDAEGLEAAKFVEGAPGEIEREVGYHAFRAQFTLDAIPDQGLALLGFSEGDNVKHFLNGKLIAGRGSMDIAKPDYRGNRRSIEHIPAGALRLGENSITAVTVQTTPRATVLAPPLLADYGAATTSFAWREFLQSDFHTISVAATFLLALLIATVAWRSTQQRIAIWLAVLSLSWVLYALIPYWVSFPFNGAVRVWSLAMAYLVLNMAWPCFVDAWTKRPWRFFQPAVVLLFGGVILVATAIAIFDQRLFSSFVYDAVLNYAGIFAIVLTASRLIWHFVTKRDEERIWEGAIMLLILLLFGWHIYDFVAEGRSDYMLSRAQPFLLAAIVIGFIAGRFHLFRSVDQINRILQEKLDRREVELADAHAREKIFVRQQAFGEERQRIMRDMHDGLGSQLMGMLLAARRGKADPPKVAEGLQQVIDELRLMIDSMDSVGDSLGAALAGFRNRLQPRIEDAGFAFEWENELGDRLPSFAPRRALQLFRIMQEAVTNALKHSDGSTVSISLQPGEGEGGLRVFVRDDGKGIDGPRLGGHGLENMRARALKEGGTVDYGAAPGGGGEVRIDFPASDQVGDQLP